jgi:hypothetical protein
MNRYIFSNMWILKPISHISFEAHRILWRILCDSSIPVPVLMNAEVLSPTAGSPASAISSIDPEITQNACTVLTDLLQGDTRQDDRNALLNLCIDCLKKHDPGTVWALRILTRIICKLLDVIDLSLF